MQTGLSFHEARRIITLIEEWPEGRIRLVDGELRVDAMLGDEPGQAIAPADDAPVVVGAPAVGVFRTVEADDEDTVIGLVEAPGRVTSIRADAEGGHVELLVEDGAFLAYGTPVAMIHPPEPHDESSDTANGVSGGETG